MLFVSTLVAAGNYTISKIAMPEYIEPSAIIFIRVITSIILFTILQLIFSGEKVERKDYIRFAGCGLFGVAINQLLFYEGLNLTTPINASLMMTISPVLILLISAFAREEKLTWRKSLGIFFGATGAASLLLYSSKSSLYDIFLGDLFVFLNALSWALFLVTAKPLMNKYHPLTVSRYMFSIGFFMILPFSYQSFLSTNWSKFNMEAILSLGYILIFATFLAYLLNIAVLRHVNPSVAGSYIYLQPMMATLIATVYGSDLLTPEKILFSLLIFTGVFLVSSKTKKVNQ